MCAPNYLFIAPGAILTAFGVALTTLLMVGPATIFGVVLNTRAELCGVISASVGVQVISIGLYSRVFSFSDPMKVSKPTVEHFIRRLSLEKGLVIALTLVIIGIAGDLVWIIPWLSSGSRALGGVRDIIFWSLWILLGVQVGFSSIFLSMLGIGRNLWQGQYLE